MGAEKRSAQRGFSLVEMLVTLFIVTLILLVALGLFDFNQRIARVQIDVADVQQSVRVAQRDMVRLARMAGRGGLPIGPLPAGLAFATIDNVPVDTFVDPADREHRVVPGTDVLVVRGVIETPVYRIVPGSFTVDTALASPSYGTGSFQLAWEASPTIPVPQNLGPLLELDAEEVADALVLTSALDDAVYAVVELDPTRTSVPASPGIATIGFRFRDGERTTEYLALSGGVWNPLLTDAAYAGILEEHRYYVRELRDQRAQLVRARVFPNSTVPYRETVANWGLALADQVMDLQVALGVDRDGDGAIADNGGDDDEWYFNHADDDPTEIAGNPLLYLRVNTLGLTPRPDLHYQAPRVGSTENHDYGVAAGDPVDGEPRRRHRRRALTTTIDLRNFS
jgi:prepilin-type N-terminal cleavage/methylation domain-containing protein